MISSGGTPPAEFPLDVDLARRLLRAQHEDLAGLPIEEAASGWDNRMFRLGTDLALRFPRRALAAEWIDREHIWLPRLAAGLTLRVPSPLRLGLPGHGYPWRWSVVPWIDGMPAGEHGVNADEARPFAAFLHSLHRPAPADAPANPFRGVPLERRAGDVTARMSRLRRITSLIGQDLEDLWSRALDAKGDPLRTWLHGDLHPGNVLVRAGALAGVIDWGDLCAGDPATDLAAVWMLFDDVEVRAEILRGHLSLTEATLARARGWAVFFGVVLLDTGLVDNEAHARIGERTLRRLLAD